MGYIYLVRHGQASFGKDNYDILSRKGVQQAKYLGSELKERRVAVNKVYSGDMKRHFDTARHCLENLAPKPFDIIRNTKLNEFDHRDIIEKYNPKYKNLDKMKFDIFASLKPKEKTKEIMTGVVSRWTSGEYDDYNESWEEFLSRVHDGLNEIRNSLDKEENAIIFTSGGTISVIMKNLMNLDIEKTFRLQLHTANASVTTLKTKREGVELVSFNDYSHFLRKRDLLTFR